MYHCQYFFSTYILVKKCDLYDFDLDYSFTYDEFCETIEKP